MADARSSASGKGTSWHSVPAAEALERLETGAGGLSRAEAAARLRRHGPNTLPRRKPEGPLTLLWRQVNSPLIWVLVASSGVAVAMGKVLDGAVVFGVIVLNTLIGFVQELRAGRAIEALGRMVPETATAVRDGARVSVPAAELVPGDVVALQSGDRVPADMRLLEARSLMVEEAALTGESVPAEKRVQPAAAEATVGDRHSMVFGGTLVTFGTATAVVVSTGAETELGRISDMLEEATDLDTPLTRALKVVASWITIAIVVVALVMLVLGTLRLTGQGLLLATALQDAMLFAIALAVGAIPEGLPAIVTIALAIGVQRMAARRAVIRKLPAVETLGSTTVICSDKTGTLTRNEMTVQALWTPRRRLEVTGVGYEPRGELVEEGRRPPETPADARRLLLDAALASDATVSERDGHWQVAGDPTEGALVVAAAKLGVDVTAERRRHPRLDAIPFESERQFMATLHATPEGGRRVILKGAPEVVLARCATVAAGVAVDRDAVLAEVERMAGRGMRVLAVAAKDAAAATAELEDADADAGFELVGLEGMIDPPRPEAVAAVAACRDAGIAVKMITGDHVGTARAIGRELGLEGTRAALTGVELERLDEPGFREAARQVGVFARVAPEHKLKLVRALQAERQVVAMTGDGVNDAPALKQADIGVAMGITGTAVSREAAEVVLTDDNFATIVAAVEEGRRVYDNLVKSLAFVLPTNLALALILASAVLIFPFDATTGELLLPMQPTQLLWINLVATVALALPLAFEAKEPNVMRRPPRRPEEPILSPFVLARTAVVTVLIAASAIALFLYEYLGELGRGVAPHTALAEAQTMTVTTVILFQVFYLLNCRSLKDSILKIGLFSNPAVYLGILVMALLQLAFVYSEPLQWLFGTAALNADAWVKSILAAVVVLPVITVEKALRRRATG